MVQSGGELKQLPKVIQFLCGGVAGMASILVVHPVDVLKNRMQLSSVGSKEKEFKNTFHAAQIIVESDGVTGLYKGMSASLFRQSTYTTTKLGVYSLLFDHFSIDGEPPAFYLKVFCGLSSGVTAAVVGNPADVCLIRMASDGRLPPGQRRGYTNVFNALIRIIKEEGVPTLWRGILPTMGRAMITNSVQLSSYSQAKQFLIETGYFRENLMCYFCSSLISGFLTTVASLPADMAKTRVQSMHYIDGKPEYKGAIDVIVRVVRNEGFLALWKGFTPYYNYQAPQTVITLVVYEYLIRLYKQYFLQGKCTTLCL